MGFIEFWSPYCGYIIVILFVDVIIELHAMDKKKCSIIFPLESESGFNIHYALYFVYVVHAFITSN